MDAYELLKWCEQAAMPLLIKHCPDRIEAVQADLQRLARLLASKDEVTICFLGNSGVGKSTLLNAIAAGASQILPAGGIGPLTAQATEVRFSSERYISSEETSLETCLRSRDQTAIGASSSKKKVWNCRQC